MRVAALLLSGALAVGVVSLPTPARADEVAVAQARVDQLQALVRRTTTTLTEGTRRWEADQASLRTVSRQLRNTQRHVKEAEAVAAEGRARAGALARRLYMTPGQDSLRLAFTKGPDEIIGALTARNALNQVAGGDSAVVRRAQLARLRLQAQERLASQLTTEATELVARSAKRLAGLEALAQNTADQLVSAQDALQKARARRTAREAAARARAARERATRLQHVTTGPACSGASTAGQANGNLDPAALCPLWMAPGERLRADAAAAFNKLSRYHAATAGGPLCVSDSYRSYSEQVAVYRSKPGMAAVPGTSEHGWGKAVDFCGGIERSGTAAYAWMKANAGRFGWFHPDWAEPSGNRPEPWHWEFNG